MRIAYWAMGEGPPIVSASVNLVASNIQRELAFPVFRDWYERLTPTNTVIRFDNRGCGLSDANASDYSLGGLSLDIDAVADALSLDEFALFGGIAAAGLAIGYAATRPERVSSLILWCPSLGNDAIRDSPAARVRAALRAIDPEIAQEILLRAGWGLSEDGRELMEHLDANRSEVAARAFDAAGTGQWMGQLFDVQQLAAEVKAPTLVLNPSDAVLFPVDWASDVAAVIPNAELEVVPGDSQSPLLSLAREVTGRTAAS